jgi:hypothetical protein
MGQVLISIEPIKRIYLLDGQPFTKSRSAGWPDAALLIAQKLTWPSLAQLLDPEASNRRGAVAAVAVQLIVQVSHQ